MATSIFWIARLTNVPPKLEQAVAQWEQTLARQVEAFAASQFDAKTAEKERKQLQNRLAEAREQLEGRRKKQAVVETSPPLRELAAQHPQIGQAVLEETAKLHEGDAENLRLWHEFLPPCREALEATYRRLNVTFDETIGWRQS
jgi:arginyl-tRNA synthetase